MFYPIYLNENGDNPLKIPGQPSRIDRPVFEGQAWEILSRLDYQHLHQDELWVEQTEAGTAASHRIARRPRFRAAGTERAPCPRCFPKMYPVWKSLPASGFHFRMAAKPLRAGRSPWGILSHPEPSIIPAHGRCPPRTPPAAGGGCRQDGRRFSITRPRTVLGLGWFMAGRSFNEKEMFPKGAEKCWFGKPLQ